MARVAKKYRERIQEEFWDLEGSYWIHLKNGWKNGNDPLGVCHGIVEITQEEAYSVLRMSMPCDCEDCVRA